MKLFLSCMTFHLFSTVTIYPEQPELLTLLPVSMMKRHTRKCVLMSRAGSDSASPPESLLPAGRGGPCRAAGGPEDGPCMARTTSRGS